MKIKRITTGALSVLAIAAGSSYAMTEQQQIDQMNQQIQVLTQELNQLSLKTSNSIHSPKATYSKALDYLHLDYSDNVFLEALPSVGYELAVLQQEQQNGLDGVTIGGYLEQDNQYWNGDQITATYHHGSGIYLTTFNLDLMARLNSWVTVVGRTEASNLGSSTSPMVYRSAFVTLGDLNKNPFYLTAGKDYVPFGTFGGNGVWMVSITRALFRPSPTNEIIAGYYKSGLNTALSVFTASNFRRSVSDFAYDVAYSDQLGKVGYTVGASYLNDVRGTNSAVGSAYLTGGGLYNGGNSKIIPATDVNASLSYGIYNLSGEYVFLWRDSTATGGTNAGKISSWNIAGSASPLVYGKALTLGLAYSHSSNASAVPLSLAGMATTGATAPYGIRGQWIGYIVRPITKNYYLGAEVVDDKLYQDQDTYAFTIDNSLYF